MGGNATFLLNIPPTRGGLLHENDVARLRELGEYLHTSYGANLADSAMLTASSAAPGHGIGCARTADEAYYLPAAENGTAEIFLRWDAPQAIRRVVLMEQLLCSQRVERFAIDAEADGAWQQVAEGTVIGHKRIVVLEGVTTAALRVRILDARVAPTLRFIGVYA